MKRLAVWLAVGLGCGYSPLAPGTVGTLPGLLIAAAIAPLGPVAQAGVIALLVLAAVPVCGIAEREFGNTDDGRIVADEYATFPIVLLGLPWTANPWLLGLAFVTHRVLDVIKPPPAGAAQRLRGGWGIVSDDVISSLYALGLNHAIFWAVS